MADYTGYRIKKDDVRKGHFLTHHDVTFVATAADGTESPEQTHEIVDPGDSVAVLAYHRHQKAFVLVRHFRIATVINELRSPWIVELPAGKLEPAYGESRRQCARREFWEETRFWIEDEHRFKPIGTIYPSPGMSTEKISIFYVELDDNDTSNLTPSGDELLVPYMAPEEDVFKELSRYSDAKLVIALRWFRDQVAETSKIPSNLGPVIYEFEQDKGLAGKRRDPARRIGILPGSLETVHSKIKSPIDVWVNSENTDMLMDRFFGKSVSATIRRLGAETFDGTIYSDTIAQELREKMGGNLFVAPGTVLATGPGNLACAPYNVRAIFHAAAVQGLPGKGLFADPHVSASCVQAVLDRAGAYNEGFDPRRHPLRALWRGICRRKPYRSILVPLLGAGQGGRSTQEIINKIVPAAIEFMQQHPDALLREIYFLAYTDKDVFMFEEELGRYTTSKVRVLTRIEPASQDGS